MLLGVLFVLSPWLVTLALVFTRRVVARGREVGHPRAMQVIRVGRRGAVALWVGLAVSSLLAFAWHALKVLAAIAQVAPANKSTMLSAAIAEILNEASYWSFCTGLLVVLIQIGLLGLTVGLSRRTTHSVEE